jgi:hypothetical protein
VVVGTHSGGWLKEQTNDRGWRLQPCSVSQIETTKRTKSKKVTLRYNQ